MVGLGNKFFELNNTNVKVEFSIIGENFNPNVITENLSIEPTESYLKGDKVKNKDVERKETCWELSTEYEESLDINTQLDKVVSKVINKKDDLIKLIEKYNLEIIVAIVVNVENNEKPSMHFNKEFIKFCNDISAEFYIDLYIYS